MLWSFNLYSISNNKMSFNISNFLSKIETALSVYSFRNWESLISLDSFWKWESLIRLVLWIQHFNWYWTWKGINAMFLHGNKIQTMFKIICKASQMRLYMYFIDGSIRKENLRSVETPLHITCKTKQTCNKHVTRWLMNH